MHSGAVTLAHQGGWDEVLLVLAPIGLFAVLLYIANKRAARVAGDDQIEGADDEADG